jgi:tellurite resistance protein TerC
MREIPIAVWLTFGLLLLALLVLDLVAHRGGREQSRRAAVLWTVVWIGAGLAFNLFVWWQLGRAAAGEYLAAYLIEKSLSLDNVFVFLIIFAELAIPREYQRRVLTYGIFGALVFRAIFIWAGVRAMEQWTWVTYLFAAVLLFTAVRVARDDPQKKKTNAVVGWLQRVLPFDGRIAGEHFLRVVDGRRVVTPLLLALIAVELTDIAFAVDSVPAAFAVSRDPFVVYTSNAFAILGLRSLYVLVAHVLNDLRYLHYGLAGVLAFAALKIISAPWLHLPAYVSVAIILVVIGASVIASLIARGRHPANLRPASAN